MYPPVSSASSRADGEVPATQTVMVISWLSWMKARVPSANTRSKISLDCTIVPSQRFAPILALSSSRYVSSSSLVTPLSGSNGPCHTPWSNPSPSTSREKYTPVSGVLTFLDMPTHRPISSSCTPTASSKSNIDGRLLATIFASKKHCDIASTIAMYFGLSECSLVIFPV